MPPPSSNPNNLNLYFNTFKIEYGMVFGVEKLSTLISAPAIDLAVGGDG